MKPERTTLTKEQLETERILANVADLPVGKTITLLSAKQEDPIAYDGFGGLVVKRHSNSTFVFQRQHDTERSRWADNLGEAYEEIAYWVEHGKLHPPTSERW